MFRVGELESAGEWRVVMLDRHMLGFSMCGFSVYREYPILRSVKS